MRACGEDQHRRAFPEPYIVKDNLEKTKWWRATRAWSWSVVAGRSSKRQVKTMLVPGDCDILGCA